MECWNRLLEFVAHHAEVNWEEFTAFLFYGMAIVAIALMIKIFIDLSADDGKPRRRFVHSKSLYELRSRLSGLFSNEKKSSDSAVDRANTQPKASGRARFDLTDDEEDSDESVFTAKQVDEIYKTATRLKRKKVC